MQESEAVSRICEIAAMQENVGRHRKDDRHKEKDRETLRLITTNNNDHHSAMSGSSSLYEHLILLRFEQQQKLDRLRELERKMNGVRKRDWRKLRSTAEVDEDDLSPSDNEGPRRQLSKKVDDKAQRRSCEDLCEDIVQMKAESRAISRRLRDSVNAQGDKRRAEVRSIDGNKHHNHKKTPKGSAIITPKTPTAMPQAMTPKPKKKKKTKEAVPSGSVSLNYDELGFKVTDEDVAQLKKQNKKKKKGGSDRANAKDKESKWGSVIGGQSAPKKFPEHLRIRKKSGSSVHGAVDLRKIRKTSDVSEDDSSGRDSSSSSSKKSKREKERIERTRLHEEEGRNRYDSSPSVGLSRADKIEEDQQQIYNVRLSVSSQDKTQKARLSPKPKTKKKSGSFIAWIGRDDHDDDKPKKGSKVASKLKEHKGVEMEYLGHVAGSSAGIETRIRKGGSQERITVVVPEIAVSSPRGTAEKKELRKQEREKERTRLMADAQKKKDKKEKRDRSTSLISGQAQTKRTERGHLLPPTGSPAVTRKHKSLHNDSNAEISKQRRREELLMLHSLQAGPKKTVRVNMGVGSSDSENEAEREQEPDNRPRRPSLAEVSKTGLYAAPIRSSAPQQTRLSAAERKSRRATIGVPLALRLGEQTGRRGSDGAVHVDKAVQAKRKGGEVRFKDPRARTEPDLLSTSPPNVPKLDISATTKQTSRRPRRSSLVLPPLSTTNSEAEEDDRREMLSVVGGKQKLPQRRGSAPDVTSHVLAKPRERTYDSATPNKKVWRKSAPLPLSRMQIDTESSFSATQSADESDTPSSEPTTPTDMVACTCTNNNNAKLSSSPLAASLFCRACRQASMEWHNIPKIAPTNGYVIYDDGETWPSPRSEQDTAYYYRVHFVGKEHTNWIGTHHTLGPVAISMRKDQHTYYAFIRTKTYSKFLALPVSQLHSKFRAPSSAQLLHAFDPALTPRGVRELTQARGDEQLEQDLMSLENVAQSTGLKFGVVYCAKPGQSEDEIYTNSVSNPYYDKFLSLLGKKVELKDWPYYSGGLDTSKYGESGRYSYYDKWENREVMFHVASLITEGSSRKNPTNQLLECRRHIGNDVCVVVFKNGNESFSLSEMQSKYNKVYIVVNVEEGSTIEAPIYSLAIASKDGVPMWKPKLPAPPVFNHGNEFREFLFAKLINGEKAALSSPDFAARIQNGRGFLLEDLHERLLRRPSRHTKSVTIG